MKRLYYKYSDYLRDKYGEKVYKLPINLPVTCPNRKLGKTCTFCGEKGAGHESLPNVMTIKEQISNNRGYIEKRYKAKKFIAYLQNYTNTFMSLNHFKEYIEACKEEGIVEISISTRPDCIRKEYLDFLYDFQRNTNINISFELGLQTANYHTLEAINRGHTLAHFIDAVLQIHEYNFPICAHVILNLPGDSDLDTLETARILSALKIEAVKLHSLYIVKNTPMAIEYKAGQLDLIDCEHYQRRVIAFLEHLNPNMVVQRIMARAPEDETLFANWGRSWWIIKEEIEETMIKEETYQGKYYDYLNGKGLNVL